MSFPFLPALLLWTSALIEAVFFESNDEANFTQVLAAVSAPKGPPFPGPPPLHEGSLAWEIADTLSAAAHAAENVARKYEAHPPFPYHDEPRFYDDRPPPPVEYDYLFTLNGRRRRFSDYSDDYEDDCWDDGDIELDAPRRRRRAGKKDEDRRSNKEAGLTEVVSDAGRRRGKSRRRGGDGGMRRRIGSEMDGRRRIGRRRTCWRYGRGRHGHEHVDHASADMDAVLDRHNLYRCMHDVPPLAWNDTLAKKAQEWADKVKGDLMPSPAAFRADYGNCKEGTGENLARGATDENAVDAWYNEIEHTSDKKGTVGSFRPSTGHFTQLVWNSTTDLGCGVYDDLIVCEYSCAGNIEGQFMDNVQSVRKVRSECEAG